MSSDVQALRVYDDRVFQSAPKFGVTTGGINVTNVNTAAISATSAQSSFQIQVPSEQTFIDRHLLYSATCALTFTASLSAAPGGAGVPAVGAVLVSPGVNFALCAAPLTSLVSSTSITINDTTVTLNNDILRALLRLVDFRSNRLVRTMPQYLDTYANYDDAYGTLNNPIGSYNDSTTPAEVPNGAWADITFLYPPGSANAGQPIPKVAGAYSASATTVTIGATTYNYDSNGLPTATTGVQTYPLAIAFSSSEPLFLAPFIFAEEAEFSTGLYGIQNISVVFSNQSPDVARVLRSNSVNGTTIGSIAYFNLPGSGSPFTNSNIQTAFLTPPLSLSLPPKSVVPWQEYPRYTTGVTVPALGGALQSQTISAPFVPDTMIAWIQPNQYGAQDADWYFPITNVSIQFSNSSSLCSTYSVQQLYNFSKANGLGELSYNQWRGKAYDAKSPASQVALSGAPVVLKFGKDIPLADGVAPSLPGQWTIQVQLTVDNNTGLLTANAGTPVATAATMYVVLVNSGFFESLRGSSRIVKGVLNQQQILDAELPIVGTHSSVARMIGHGFFDKIANAISKGREIVSAIAPVVSAAKPAIEQYVPHGKKISQGLSAVGLGRRQSLAHRLM